MSKFFQALNVNKDPVNIKMCMGKKQQQKQNNRSCTN